MQIPIETDTHMLYGDFCEIEMIGDFSWYFFEYLYSINKFYI